MKGLLVLFALACIIGVSVGDYCGSLESCSPGQCCSGGFYHRYCRSFADKGEPCEVPNPTDSYKVACPCKEGLTCSIIRRCQ